MACVLDSAAILKLASTPGAAGHMAAEEAWQEKYMLKVHTGDASQAY